MNTLDTTHLVAIAAALGWASGLRLYAVLFITGMAGWQIGGLHDTDGNIPLAADSL